MPPPVNVAEAKLLPVAQRSGTALEWTCVDECIQGVKACRCCGHRFAGGPDRIALHVLKVTPTWQWWRTYGRQWPHLRWFAMRLTAHGASASACERNWSTYEWVHSKKRNRLGVVRAEKLVRTFSNLGLLSRNEMYEAGFVEWDEETVFEEPDDEPATRARHSSPRSSPHRAARPPLGTLGPRPRAVSVQAAAVSAVAAPVVGLPVTGIPQGIPLAPVTHVQVLMGQPQVVAGRGRGRAGSSNGRAAGKGRGRGLRG